MLTLDSARPINPQTHIDPVSIPNPPLKIREVVTMIFLSLAIAFSLLGTIGIIIGAIAVESAAAVTLLTISTIGLGILGILSLWDLVIPYCPKFIRHIAYTIQTVVTEIFAFLSLMCLAFVDLTKKNPKEINEIDPNETPVLLIHGFLGSSKDWIYQRERLIAAGRKNVFTINLGNPLNSIDTYAKRVDDLVNEIKALTGRNDIIVVGHSMGGLVARQWRYKYGTDTDVRDIVTIGTPLKGTYAAWLSLGISACGREMFPNSSLINEQQEWAAKDSKTNYYHIGSDVDIIILPNSSAQKGGSPHNNTRVELVETAGHAGLLFSDYTGDLLVDYVNNRNKASMDLNPLEIKAFAP